MPTLIEQYIRETLLMLADHPPVIMFCSLASDEEPEPFVVPLDYGYEAES